jgi:hypothetical protein
MAAIKKTPVKKPDIELDVELIEEEEQEVRTDHAQYVKEQCDAMDKVPLMIPLNPLEPADDIVPISISGYTWQVKRGVQTMVPRAIADTWYESYNATIRAETQIAFNADPVGTV